MTQTLDRTGKESYLAAFAEIEPAAADNGAGWLMPLRREALERFEQLGFPTRRDEKWRHTNVAPIATGGFRAAPAADAAALAGRRYDEFTFGALKCHRLTFVNGRFAPALSRVHELPAGVRLMTLGRALQSEKELLGGHLSKYADHADDAFIALNTALLQDGVYLHVAKGVAVEHPIHLLFISGGQGRTASYPRNLVVVEEGAKASVLESYRGIGEEDVYFTNAVTEFVVGAGAQLDHYKIQRESLGAFHVANQQAHIGRAANFKTELISLGAALARNNSAATMDGERVECLMNGLYLASGTQHVDNHTELEHAAPHCASREVYKGILDDEATGSFTGKIYVHQAAQKTDAKQSNRNLLLSPTARANAEPQLEIFADDVKCTHGATVGQLDENQIFYLRSRGIDRNEAEGLLTYAFANEIVEAIQIPEVREQLEKLVFERFHG